MKITDNHKAVNFNNLPLFLCVEMKFCDFIHEFVKKLLHL